MPNPRTSISDLELQGSPNLNRALKREKAEDAAPALTPDERSEIERLTELIDRAMKACKKGSTVQGKRNPAFQNLAMLVKARDTLLRGKRPEKKTSAEILAEAEKALTTPGVN